jgi:hypothetical protein
MDVLIQNMQECQITNPLHHSLFVFDGCVFTSECIKQNTYIGHIEGERKYIWEVAELTDDIVWIEDDLVIDCTQRTQRPKCITSMIREGHDANCLLVINPHTNHVGITTTKDIMCGNELIFCREHFVSFF